MYIATHPKGPARVPVWKQAFKNIPYMASEAQLHTGTKELDPPGHMSREVHEM